MTATFTLIRFRSSALFFTVLMTSLSLQTVHAMVIYENDFEDDPVGTYTVANLAADWNGTTSNDGVDEGRVSITDDANAFGNKSMVVMYPDGLSNLGKSQWKMDVGGSYDELYLSYRIRFDDNFDFVRGGKLPGLCGGACNSGGSRPNGTDGWSARMMWRTDGSSGSPLDPDRANIVQYVYHPDQTASGGINGDDLKWDDTTPTDWKIFDSDVWYHVQHRVVMNTPGVQDGIVQAWLDGEMVLDKQNIRFRDIASLKIDTLYFSTFFGGSSAPWETTKDEYVYFDDFVISTEFITDTVDLFGDYNGDDTINAADYTAWRDALTAGSSSLLNDPTPGTVDESDFLYWRAHFGETAGSGAGADSAAVPEPASAALLLIGIVAGALVRRPFIPAPAARRP